MSRIMVAGIDPSLNNTGLAKGYYDTETKAITITAIKLVETENFAGKTVRKNSDDLRRAVQIIEGIHGFTAGVGVTFAEVPSGAQSARGALSNGICLGVLASVGLNPGGNVGRLIQVLPHEVKLASVGVKNAAKHEVIEWAMENYPDLPWEMWRGKPKDKNEHCADAIAAIWAGCKTDEFRNLVSALANLTFLRQQ
jgi:Holliday junction resolvasome RuvABC endonuclease subunit